MDNGTLTLQAMITQLPNFAGLIIALFIMVRQNTRLTEALIALTRDCDCSDKGDRVIEKLLDTTHINSESPPASTSNK